MRTAKMYADRNYNLIHAALGLASEAGELATTINAAWMQLPFDPDNIVEELGDAFWFSAYLAQLMDARFEDLTLEPANASDMSNELAAAVLGRNPVALCMCLNAFAGDVATIVKSHVIYGKDLDDTMLLRKLQLYVTTLHLLSNIHDIPVDYVLTSNISKLQQRYPGSYSDNEAIARKDKPRLVIVQ